MPRPSNTEVRRRQITHASIGLIARQGYGGASVSRIAARARVAPGIVHYHFENKLEILLDALDDLASRHDSRLNRALLRAKTDATSQVDAFVDAHLGMGPGADPDAVACWVAIGSEALRNEKVRAAYTSVVNRLMGRLEEIIRCGCVRGELSCPEPRTAAAAIFAAIQGYFELAATVPDAIPPGTASFAVQQMARPICGTRSL
jgi:TetR/AcrR family transcriptional repressor of bet genes